MQGPPAAGAPVWVRHRRWRVDRSARERHVVRLDLSNATSQLTVLTPFDRARAVRPETRPTSVRRQRGAARLAAELGASPGARLAHTLIEGRLDLWPHQAEPVLAALSGHRRLLIADDVGLGKTIQAAAIVAEALRRHPSSRALIVTPASLCAQWVDELHRHFGIRAFGSADRMEAIAHQPRGANPWSCPGVHVTSLDYLKQPHVFSALPLDAWDVVVVDEVHQAAGRSDRHETCDELGHRARVLVLLSATPHDGDAAKFARLVRLGEWPHQDDPLTVFRRTRRDVAMPVNRVVRWHRVGHTRAAARLAHTLEEFERTVLAHATAPGRDDALLFLSVLRKRLLSSASALERTLDRRLAWLASAAATPRTEWQQPAFAFSDTDEDGDEGEWLGIRVGLTARRERAWLRRLRAMAAGGVGDDPRLRRLRALVTRTAEPVVVFTEYRDTLEAIVRAIGTSRRVAAIHGGQTSPARQGELDRFLSGDASVLVATDVGSQGLNLQARSRWAVIADLPWNPMRLEQRVGRLDRLGQQQRVHVTVLLGDSRAERTVLLPMLRRALTARQQLDAEVFDSVAPPARLVVASAVLGSGDDAGLLVPPARVVVPAPTRAFQRCARAHTTVARRRRLLEGPWQGARTPGERPMLVRLPSRASPANAGAVSVVAIPIVDGTGDVVERRLVVVATERGIERADDVRRLTDAATLACTRLFDARLDRLRRLATRVCERRLCTERGLAAHLHGLRYPRATQMALFSQRPQRAFDDARLQAARDARAADQRTRIEQARCRLAIGAPSVLWIAVRR